MAAVTQIAIAVIPVLILSTASAIYLNRRRSNRLYQRLFGMDDDPADEGYVPAMTERMETIDANVKELNHQRINDIEDRLDDLQAGLSTLQAHYEDDED